jgi:CheY-like chemotaxis protein
MEDAEGKIGRDYFQSKGGRTMRFPLHILHFEDDPKDAALVQSTLEAEGITCAVTWVQDRGDFVAALRGGGFDLIISGFTLREFAGLSAVAAVRAGWPDLPIILVSGTLGEELAIDSLESGATDYVFKDHLCRLAPAVRRAMQEVEEKAIRRRLEAQFIEAQKMATLANGVAHDFNNILMVIISYNDLIMSKVGLESPLRKFTEEIRDASERASGLTRLLLVSARKQRLAVLAK